MPRLKPHLTKKLFVLLRLALLGAVAWGVYGAFRQHQTGLADVYAYARHALTPRHALWLTVVVLLTPLNWSLEALKWQALAQKIQAISFGEAFRGVMAGLSLNFATPASLGDFAGRIWNLPADRRLENLGAVLLGNGLQFYVSLLGGTAGFAYFLLVVLPQPTAGHWVLFALLVAALTFGLWIAARRGRVPLFFRKIAFLRPYERFFNVVARYSPAELGRVLGWAALRYGVFSVQFLLVLRVFNVSLGGADALSAVTLVFFAKTIVPAFHFLSDLGVREYTALYFFGFFGVAPAAVVSATLTLWAVNILLPVAVGSFGLLRLRLGAVPAVQPLDAE